MKKVYIFTIFLICFIIFLIYFFFFNSTQGNEIIKVEFIKDGNFFILYLPYEIEDNIEYVFDEDTPYAIDIIEIRADGKKLSFIEDTNPGEPRTFFNIHKIIQGKNTYYILMLWMPRYSGEVLNWYHGRGFTYTEIEHNAFEASSNTYEISRNTKKLEISYRILLPYPSLSIDDFYNKTYINNFTKEYTISVDMSKFRTLLR